MKKRSNRSIRKPQIKSLLKYLSIGSLIFASACIVFIAQILTKQQTILSMFSKAFENTIPSKGAVDITYPIGNIDVNNGSLATPSATGGVDMSCSELSNKYLCVLGSYSSNPDPAIPECYRRFHPKCRIPGTNQEDRSQKPIPPGPDYKDCAFVPGEGLVCNFTNSCIYLPGLLCHPETTYWQFIARYCGCYTCTSQGTGFLNGKDTGFGNRYTCSIKCANGSTRYYDKATGYSQDQCNNLAKQTCGCT